MVLVLGGCSTICSISLIVISTDERASFGRGYGEGIHPVVASSECDTRALVECNCQVPPVIITQLTAPLRLAMATN